MMSVEEVNNPHILGLGKTVLLCFYFYPHLKKYLWEEILIFSFLFNTREFPVEYSLDKYLDSL